MDFRFIGAAARAGAIQIFKRNKASRRRKPQRGLRLHLEMLESRVLMHSNPVLDAEHAAVFGDRNETTGVVTGGLVPDASLTYISVPDAAPKKWSDPTTWRYVGPAPANGSTPSLIPDTGANVLISVGSVVIVDKEFDVSLHTIRDDGLLRFDPHVNTKLLVDTILVTPLGTIQMGTDPMQKDALGRTGRGERIDPNKHAALVFADNGPIDRKWDPLLFSRGLISHGTVSMFGATVTGFEQLYVDAKAHDTKLVLDETPNGWKVGDRLVLTGDTATDSRGQNRDEEVEIVAISQTSDHRTVVTVTDPNADNWSGLKYDHAVATGYVANTTRNVVLLSENTSVIAQRGHVMFMHGEDFHIDAAGFYGLGRTDKTKPIDDAVLSPDPDHPGQMTIDRIDPASGKRVMTPVLGDDGRPVVVNGVVQLQPVVTGQNQRARYPVHFHRTEALDDSTPSVVDSVVVDSPGWGIVNHSSVVNISGNVVFNVTGAAYATEAGDERGTFDHNIAIHSDGSGAGLDSRQSVQDFGHQGNGFWLQGGNVSVTNNIVAGQRAGAYVFFPRGLEQKGLGVTTVPTADLVNPAWAGRGQSTIPVGKVPLREFKGNIAFASARGYESWYTMEATGDKFPDQRNLIEDFTSFSTSGDNGMLLIYTGKTTFKNVSVVGNINAPNGTGVSRGGVTQDIVFENSQIVGWGIGIDFPVTGKNEVHGGFFNNVVNLLVTPATSAQRSVIITGNADAQGQLDPDQPQFGTLSAAALRGRRQWDIALSTVVDQAQESVRQIAPLLMQLGTVTLNDQQLYYKQQAANFKPFDPASGSVGVHVPADLVNKTNQQLFENYGLAFGTRVAPAGSTASNSRIDALLGPPSSNPPDVRLLNDRFISQNQGPFFLAYQYYDPTNPQAQGGYVNVRESKPTTLANGWNLLTRNILGVNRTLLVYGDSIAPEFVLRNRSPQTITKADVVNGAVISLEGDVTDNSLGSRRVQLQFRLNDPQYVSPLQSDVNGSFVIVTFPVKDYAGNLASIQIRISVTLPSGGG